MTAMRSQKPKAHELNNTYEHPQPSQHIPPRTVRSAITPTVSISQMSEAIATGWLGTHGPSFASDEGLKTQRPLQKDYDWSSSLLHGVYTNYPHESNS